MKCIAVKDVKFSKEGIEAIEDIRRRNKLAGVLSIFMSAGTVANIFVGNGVLKSTYNISQTDFAELAKAMASIPKFQRVVIRKIAGMQILERAYPESLFWKGVVDGCRID